jgi:hypothetical protein
MLRRSGLTQFPKRRQAWPDVGYVETTHDARRRDGDKGADASIFGRIVMTEFQAEMVGDALQ